MRRVVITGIGTVNALGLDVATSYPRILAGENGVTTIDRFDTTGISATIGAQVDWDPEACGFDVKDQRKLDPFTMWAMMASDEALKDAGMENPRDLSDETRERIGTIIGTGIRGMKCGLTRLAPRSRRTSCCSRTPVMPPIPVPMMVPIRS
ncbi:MAG: beta-ketoacyl synthase N-terminal-like domain-containing protein, partial [Planctomycetota bacterium]